MSQINASCMVRFEMHFQRSSAVSSVNEWMDEWMEFHKKNCLVSDPMHWSLVAVHNIGKSVYVLSAPMHGLP